MELSVPLHFPVCAFCLPYRKYFSIVSFSTISSRVRVTWCSIWMAVLRSGVQVEPQTPALLAVVNKAVELLCEFIFFDLRPNVISRLVPFWCSSSGWMSRALGDGQLEVNYVQVLCGQGALATAFDLATFWPSMIAPVKKSVSHPKTVASMRETGWEQQQQPKTTSSSSQLFRSDSTVWSEFWSRWSLLSSL